MEPNLYSFSEIFKSGEVTRIVIPKIQRDYAQGRNGAAVARVREKFLDALYEAVTIAPIKLDFVYGDIENGVFIPLDGQQRLTTLFLLHWYAAKKEKVDTERYKYLKNFGYDTRPSARDFCSSLVDFEPEFNSYRKLSDEIIDAAWFPLDYSNDPTVSAMLVMLDAISEKFRTVDGLFEKLECGVIKFYFRSIKDMGLTDEIYIKMNSRGKPLTLFEHFKAELLRELKRIDEDRAIIIAKKIDGAWTDLLWQYSKSINNQNDKYNVDDLFLRYFRFICDIIGYGNGKSDDGSRTAVGRDNDVFNLIKLYFSKCDFNCDFDEMQKHDLEVKENIKLLEDYFDIWCKIDVKDLFGKFISKTHETNKIIYEDASDLFEECILKYADVSDISYYERKLPLTKLARLFAFTVYLIENRDDSITEADFCRRLRIIDNLINNSRNEVVDSPNSDSGNRMPKILKLIRDIITGKKLTACNNSNAFSQTQFDEEIKKEEWIKNNPDRAEELYRLEDHPILNGQIEVVGLDNPDRFVRFAALFDCDRDAVNCALLARGDFSQSYHAKFRIGVCSKDNNPWIALFHKSDFQGFESTSNVLRGMLDMHTSFTDEILRYEADKYINQCENDKKFDWRYYFIKYEIFRPREIANCQNDKSYGGYYGKGKYHQFTGPYDMAAMKRDRLTVNSYKPFLIAIGKGVSDSEDPNNIALKIRGHIITADNDGYKIYSNNGDLLQNVLVPQNNGIDTVDRVLLVKEEIKKLKI